MKRYTYPSDASKQVILMTLPIHQTIRITPASAVSDFDAARRLFSAYARLLGIDLSFQNFTVEVDTMPGQYATPHGELLLACDSNPGPIGCVAMRPILPEGCCKMKRLYVAQTGRGRGIGAALVEAIINTATRIGYHEMRVDTLPVMDAALALYRKAGFHTIRPYYETSLEGTIFLGRTLCPSWPSTKAFCSR